MLPWTRSWVRTARLCLVWTTAQRWAAVGMDQLVLRMRSVLRMLQVAPMIAPRRHGKLALRPFQQDQVAARTKALKGIDWSAKQQRVTGFKPDFTEFGSDHPRSSLYAQNNSRCETAKADKFNRAACHARAWRNHRFHKAEWRHVVIY